MEKILVPIGVLRDSQSAIIFLNKLPLRASICWRISNLVNQTQPLVENFENLRIEICKKLGKVNPETNIYEFGENQALADAEYQELYKEEITLNFKKLKIFDLEADEVIECKNCGNRSTKPVYLTGEILSQLSWLIEEE